MKTIIELQDLIKKERGKQEQLQGEVEKKRTRFIQLRKSLLYHEQALEIVKEIGLQTQQQLQYLISEVTSLALESVFEDPYSLEVEFQESRGKLECFLFLMKDGEKYDPLDSTGGGVVDIASFSLRISSWNLSTPRLRNVIFLDEPMKNLSEKYRPLAGAMIREISQKLGIQFIIVTHDPVIIDYSDRVFEITKNRRNQSKVKVL